MASQSSSRARALAWLVGPALAATALLPAAGDDDDRPWPAELGEPAALPIVDLTLPVIDPKFVTSDLEGAQEVAESDSEVDVVLDSTVLFGKDSAAVLPAARQRLRQVAMLLAKKPPGSVHIVGHTDDLGSAEHGYDLSRRRADAVKAVLAPLLPAHTITTEGKGEDEPRVPNKDEASRAKNRRVEIHYDAKR